MEKNVIDLLKEQIIPEDGTKLEFRQGPDSPYVY